MSFPGKLCPDTVLCLLIVLTLASENKGKRSLFLGFLKKLRQCDSVLVQPINAPEEVIKEVKASPSFEARTPCVPGLGCGQRTHSSGTDKSAVIFERQKKNK